MISDLGPLLAQLNRQYMQLAKDMRAISCTMVKLADYHLDENDPKIIQMDMFRDDYDKPPRL